MTESQKNRVKAKIEKIKKALAADKRYWGGEYHDGGGLRYEQPGLYIKLEDYTGALRYFNWFNKHFPNDDGSPLLWFEYSLILFKTKRVERAKAQIIKIHISNEYLIDYFLDPKSIVEMNPEGNRPLQILVKYFDYKKEAYPDFSDWLAEYTESQRFATLKNEIAAVNSQLENEKDTTKRGILINRRSKLIDGRDNKVV